MIDLVRTRLNDISALCREFGVAKLYLFGSATTDAFDPERSDVDLLVEYAPETDLGPWMTRHFELEERLAEVLGRPVDLVMVGAQRNPYVRRSIEESRKLLYAA